MTRDEIEEAVRRRLDDESINPATGEAPDALLSIEAVPIHRFGATAGGVETGPESWSVRATMFFPPDDAEHLLVKVARILERFQTAIDAEPALGDEGAQLLWRGTDRGPHARLDAPAGHETAVDLLLTVRP